jgi:hypothetical protein
VGIEPNNHYLFFPFTGRGVILMFNRTYHSGYFHHHILKHKHSFQITGNKWMDRYCY